MRIRLEPANQPEVLALIDALDAHQKPLYPPESHHGIDVQALSQPEVLFAVVRSETGVAVACGAVVLGEHWGELKRMFVQPALRRRGISRHLLAFLEHEAFERGCGLLMLETGIRQPEAIGLYQHAGYQRRGPFGDYAEDPMSVFMQKRLTPP